MGIVLLTKEQASRLAIAIRGADLEVAATLAAELETSIQSGDLVVVEIRRPVRELTTAQVAEMYAVSDRTVRSWCDSGRIIAHRTPGGEWRIPADQFQASNEEVHRFRETVAKLNARFAGQPEPDDFE